MFSGSIAGKMKVFLSGTPGSGKSTVFERTVEILKERGFKVRGIATPEVRGRAGARVGFDVVDLATGQRAVLSRARTDSRPGRRGEPPAPRVGRYRVDVEAFESVARPALEAPTQDETVVAIDEVGKMEFFSSWFVELWHCLLGSEENILAVVGGPYLKECRGKGKIFEVSPENRSELAEIVADCFAAHGEAP